MCIEPNDSATIAGCRRASSEAVTSSEARRVTPSAVLSPRARSVAELRLYGGRTNTCAQVRSAQVTGCDAQVRLGSLTRGACLRHVGAVPL